MALSKWPFPCFAAVISGWGVLFLGEPARTWDADRLDWDSKLGNDRSVADPENVWLNQPERRDGKSPKWRTLLGAELADVEATLFEKLSPLEERGGRKRGLLLDGGSMITGESATSSGSPRSSFALLNNLLPFFVNVRGALGCVSPAGACVLLFSATVVFERTWSRRSVLKNLDSFGVAAAVGDDGER